MKTIQNVILVTLCFSFASGDIPGTLVGLSRLASRTSLPSCVGLVTPICRDCSILMRCLMVDPAPEVTCKAQYPGRPYCHQGSCVAEPPAECQTASEFTCMGAGYYPDPKNCSRYHLCGAALATSPAYSMYECPGGFAYNPATTMCKRITTDADCAVFDCSADPNGYVVYPADNNLFAYCSPDADPVILKCPVNTVFVPASFSCVFQCSGEGRFADLTDKTKFFECYSNGETYITQSFTCVAGYEFDANEKQCVLPATTTTPTTTTTVAGTPGTPTPAPTG